jgi:hypothetical protein
MYEKLLKELDPIGLEGCFIAGGAVLSKVTKTDIADYDIYPKTKKDAIEVCLILLDNSSFVVNVTDRAITFKSNYVHSNNGERAIFQVMIFDVFPTAQSIFYFFDFSVCMGAYDCDTKEYHFGDTFWPDIASKNIRFNPKTKYPLASMIRLDKYKAKGYYVGKGEASKVALSVAAKGVPTSWGELESQLGGIYGKSIKVQVGEEDFTLDKAYEVLSDLEFNVRYSTEDEFSWVGVDELEILLSEEPLVIYEGGWKVSEGSLVVCDFDDRILGLPNVSMVEKPMADCSIKFIKAYKYVKPNGDGTYKGAVWSGNHNDVVYKPFEKTAYEKDPYLFSYQKPQGKSHAGLLCEVRIPVEDLVREDYGKKYISKSIIMGEIHEG